MGSSSSSTGRSARKARARAIRCRWPADSPAPISPSRVSIPSGSAETKRYASASRRAARTASSSASGRASRTFSAIVPAKRYGRWGTQAIWRRQLSGSSEARSRPPISTRPWSGTANPSTAFSSVDFPAPLGPTTATVSPGRISNEVRAREGAVRPGWRTISPSSVSAAPRASGAGEPSAAEDGSARSSTANTSSAAASPSAAAWYCAPTCRSGRYASGASTSTISPVNRSISPCTSRIPMSTATSATDTVASSSRAKEDRKASRSVLSVARR